MCRFLLTLLGRGVFACGVIGVFLGGGVCHGAGGDGLSEKQLAFFEKKIRPVLVTECYGCHSQQHEVQGELRLDTAMGLLVGGVSGEPAVVPGAADESPLVKLMREGDENHAAMGDGVVGDGVVGDEVVGDFVRWIGMGAPDPRKGYGEVVWTPNGEGDRSHWSFMPVQKPTPPRVGDVDWPASDIDRYILAKQEAAGVKPVGRADRRRLIRRATFDLVGLPAELEDVEAFVGDESEDAFAKVVDRLLRSSQFGARWGRHWLDVARFAESSGHERNFVYPHAWRYRDWVIDSFNADKPYDQFIREQVSGDLLEAKTHAQRMDQSLGTGFLALGPKNHLSRGDAFALDVADDQINVTSAAFLGLTVACARCHDHKFDPITTKEYYGLAGIFLSTETMHGTIKGKGGGSNNQAADLLPLAANHDELEKVYGVYTDKVAKKQVAHDKAYDEQRKLYNISNRNEAQEKDYKAAVGRMKSIKKEMDAMKAAAPVMPPYGMAVREGKTRGDTQVRVKGVANQKGEVAPRVFPAVLTHTAPPEVEAGGSGRLALGAWLSSDENPLTARVMVNRIWQKLFGEGLVTTPDNFGTLGAAPTHPALLDYMAWRFVEEDWSIKGMIREVMLSEVYQLGARHDEANGALDADNRLLWRARVRRLEVEPIRDAMLAVSGELDVARPSYGSAAALVGDGCLVRQVNPAGLIVDEPYRSVYLPVARYFPAEINTIFDGPSAALVVAQREVTSVPAQALFLLNDEFVVQRAEAGARRLLDGEGLDDVGRIDWVYRLAFGRGANEEEIGAARSFLDGARRGISSAGGTEGAGAVKVWAGLVQALFTSAEFRYVY